MEKTDYEKTLIKFFCENFRVCVCMACTKICPKSLLDEFSIVQKLRHLLSLLKVVCTENLNVQITGWRRFGWPMHLCDSDVGLVMRRLKIASKTQT